jgi:putative membrane-bound dehydrogenase-like protein
MKPNPSVIRFVGSLAACSLLLASWGSAAQLQLDGRTFTLPDGFTIERVAGPPLVDRPIVADFDEQGRLYVDDSSGSSEKLTIQLEKKPHRVVRLEDTKGNGHFDKSTVFADHMMFPEGAMWYAGSLYVGAPPSIWKLTDTTRSGVADQRIEWFQGKTLTGCGNDIHGPYLGPDGWIYWCKGAFAEQTYPRPGKKPFVTRAAHIFRCRPDGSGIEPVMTGGMDNPVHVVFTPGGERIFTTTFLQNPANGNRDGIIHAVYGGIYGKVHDVIDDHPHTFPEVMPVLVQLGPAAACGLARYESDAFGPEYRDNLFATCFNLHKVTRHVLTEEGATFSATSQDFLTCDSLDFHPTDVIEDADGTLLVIDTGGWYKLCCPTSQLGKPDVLGAIYRVRRAGAPHVDDPRGLKLNWNSMSVDDLTRLLADPRPAVRRRAIQTVSAKGQAAVGVISKTLASSAMQVARINAVWALTRIDSSDARRAVREALKDRDETVRQAAAHSISLWRDRDAVAALLDLLAHGTPQNQRVAAEALGRIGDSRAVAPLLAALEKPVDHMLDHSLTYALIEIDDAKATAAGLSNESPQVRRSAMMALDQMDDGGVSSSVVADALSSSDAALRDTAAWIAGRHPDWGGALADAMRRRIANGAPAAGSDAQLVPQLARLAKSEAIQSLLASTVGDTKLPAGQRRIALQAIAASGLNEAPAAWVETLARVITGEDTTLLPDAIAAIKGLHVDREQAARIDKQMFDVASRSDLPPDVRLEAMSATHGRIGGLDADLFRFVRAQLAPNQPANRQLAAAEILGRSKLTSSQLDEVADAMRSAGPLEITQLLKAFAQTTDPTVGARLVASLQSATAAGALRADLLQASLSRFGPQIQQQAESLLARLNPDAGKQRARLDELMSTLPPGDVRRGQLLFNNAKAACASCHSIGYVGGHVGPDLTRVGAARSKRDLIESIVYPSASFVQSFEPMMVITNADERYYGIVRANNAQEVRLVTGPNQEVQVAKKDVKEIRPGTVSLMPAGFDGQLSPQELADLVAFLQACR